MLGCILIYNHLYILYISIIIILILPPREIVKEKRCCNPYNIVLLSRPSLPFRANKCTLIKNQVEVAPDYRRRSGKKGEHYF